MNLWLVQFESDSKFPPGGPFNWLLRSHQTYGFHECCYCFFSTKCQRANQAEPEISKNKRYHLNAFRLLCVLKMKIRETLPELNVGFHGLNTTVVEYGRQETEENYTFHAQILS